MHLPIWLAVLLAPAIFWPVTLVAAVGLGVLAAASRGRRRALAGLAAFLLALPGLAGAWYAVENRRDEARRSAEDARRQTVLAADTVIEGLPLPARTTVTWREDEHRTFVRADFPRPTEILGVPATSVQRADGGWSVETTAAREIGGWSCWAGTLTIALDGSLRSCSLDRPASWRGWTFPVHTHIHPEATGSIIAMLGGMPGPEAPEIGRRLPDVVAFNPDGSLATGTFDRASPVLVAGVPLWGEVRWRYDPATLGEGRTRPAIAVEGTRSVPPDAEGAVDGGQHVAVALPDGRVTPRQRGREP